MINLTLSVNQSITLSLNPKSFSGKVGQIKAISWEIISGNSTIDPSPNGMSALITAASTPGVTIFKIGANTNMNLKAITKWVNVDLHGPPYNPKDVSLIFNHITLNVVKKRIDSSQGKVTTNLGLSAGSPNS